MRLLVQNIFLNKVIRTDAQQSYGKKSILEEMMKQKNPFHFFVILEGK